jgi:hypothetical protein
MNGQEFFDSLNRNLSVIPVLPKIKRFYTEIAETFNEVTIIDYYCEVESEKIEVKGTLDIMFFDSQTIHRIVINKASIDFNSFPRKSIYSVNIFAANSQTKPFDINTPSVDEVKLTILINSQEQVMFNYIANAEKFSDFLRIKNNLLTNI